MYRILLLVILLISGHRPFLLAQNVDLSVEEEDSVRSAYIADFERRCMIRTYLAQRNLSLELRNRYDNRQIISYSPNVRYVMGIGAFYEKIGLEVGLAVPAPDARNQRFGRTRTLDFNTNFYGNTFGVDAILQRHRGFYVGNPILADTSWRPGDNYPTRPDLITTLLGGNAYYVFNGRRFSYRATFVQTERQTQSAGSFVLMGSLMHLHIRGNIPLVPAHFEDMSAFRRGGALNISVLPGYAHTFVRGRAYASITLFLGGGVQQMTYVADDQWRSSWRFARKNNWRFAAGYFGHSFTGGASLIIDNTPITTPNLALSVSTYSLRLFAGYRFNSTAVDRLVAKHRRQIELLYGKPRR
jgi:hypothetical protein